MSPARESQEESNYNLESRDTSLSRESRQKRLPDRAKTTPNVTDSPTELAGETSDVVTDASQETVEDFVAQSVEEGQEKVTDQPDETASPVKNGKAGYETISSGKSQPNTSSDEYFLENPDVHESAGEAGDVVLDRTQESGADTSAQSAEEEALDVAASNDLQDKEATQNS